MVEFRPFACQSVISGIPKIGLIILVVQGGSIGNNRAGFWRSDLLFVALGRRLLGLALAQVGLLSAHRLTVNSTSNIELPGLTICTPMLDIANVENLAIFEIVALGMLPGIAAVAEHGVPVVVMEATDAFDGIVFFLLRMRRDPTGGIDGLCGR